MNIPEHKVLIQKLMTFDSDSAKKIEKVIKV